MVLFFVLAELVEGRVIRIMLDKLLSSCGITNLVKYFLARFPLNRIAQMAGCNLRRSTRSDWLYRSPPHLVRVWYIRLPVPFHRNYKFAARLGWGSTVFQTSVGQDGRVDCGEHTLNIDHVATQPIGS